MNDIWIGVLGAILGAVVGAVATLVGGLVTTRHEDRRAAVDDLRSRREEWFRRVQWAETLAGDTGDAARAAAGVRMLNELVRSDLAAPDDVALIQALTVSQTRELIAAHLSDTNLATEHFVRDNEGRAPEGGRE